VARCSHINHGIYCLKIAIYIWLPSLGKGDGLAKCTKKEMEKMNEEIDAKLANILLVLDALLWLTQAPKEEIKNVSENCQ
jgi:hypothetical protein